MSPTRGSASHAFEQELAPLWLRAQQGDEAAYRAALACMACRLRAFFRWRLQSLPDEVEDLVQETLLAVHLQRGTYDAAFPVSGWVQAIARYKMIDLWRRRGRTEALHDPIDELDEDALVAPEEDSHARRDMAAMLDELPPAQRQAIVLIKVEGLTVAEASARTGVSHSALKVQVHRGLKKLAELLRRESE